MPPKENHMNAWKYTLSATVLAAAVALLPGCATFGGGSRGVVLSTSPSEPSAEGTARFNVTKNDNTGIDVEVKHLAHPDKLTPPANSYVVWTKSNVSPTPQNIGAMKVDADLNGSFVAETPLHAFDLFVTAETSGQAQAPTGASLLWTTYSR
jgi:hypothetical protein